MDQLREKIYRRWVGRLTFHVSDESSSSELPLDVGLDLKSLIRVAHHCDEEVDEDNDTQDVVESEHHFGHISGSTAYWTFRRKVLLICQSKDTEEEEFHDFHEGR